MDMEATEEAVAAGVMHPIRLLILAMDTVILLMPHRHLMGEAAILLLLLEGEATQTAMNPTAIVTVLPYVWTEHVTIVQDIRHHLLHHTAAIRENIPRTTRETGHVQENVISDAKCLHNLQKKTEVCVK